MKTLTDVYNSLAPHDAELEKQASELVKQAQEEDAAGRITARGFMDELQKLAAGAAGTQVGGVGGATTKTENFKTAPTTGGAGPAGLSGRKSGFGGPPVAKAPDTINVAGKTTATPGGATSAKGNPLMTAMKGGYSTPSAQGIRGPGNGAFAGPRVAGRQIK